ncbi:MAG: magnesium/cobalt transporter CorA [Proteobacteria bacterium]|nr:magnesium/cobalt transporter CorA [Pseudomonadota bacterium]
MAKNGKSTNGIDVSNNHAMDKEKIYVIDFNEKKLEETVIKEIGDCSKYKKRSTVSWINVNGLGNTEAINKLGKNFGIHDLVLEDILDTTQRPKIDEFDDYIFILIKMFTFNEKKKKIEIEQVSMIIGHNYVLTFQERKGDVFGIVRKRLENDKGRIRRLGADYLAYTLIDAIVDNYFIVIENVGEEIDRIENRLIVNPNSSILKTIHKLKKEMILVLKSVWPLREVIGNLRISESTCIEKTTSIYFRDIYEHVLQFIDAVEIYRDMISGQLDIYLSSINNKMNDIMKFLTIIATIFIPPTFIAGIYGMNFKNMPEYRWWFGYPVVLGVMGLIMIVMVIYFKKKKWF